MAIIISLMYSVQPLRISVFKQTAASFTLSGTFYPLQTTTWLCFVNSVQATSTTRITSILWAATVGWNMQIRWVSCLSYASKKITAVSSKTWQVGWSTFRSDKSIFLHIVGRKLKGSLERQFDANFVITIIVLERYWNWNKIHLLRLFRFLTS